MTLAQAQPAPEVSRGYNVDISRGQRNGRWIDLCTIGFDG